MVAPRPLHGVGGVLIAGGIPRDRGQGMRAITGRGRVPGDRVRRARVFGAEVGAVELELDTPDGYKTDDAHAGADRDRVGTIDPEAGDVIATIRLPSPSCAWAWVEIRERPEIASSAAAPTRLPICNMDYSFLAPLFSPDYYPPTIKGP